MTQEELEKLGIYQVSPKLRPNAYLISQIGKEINIYETTDIEDILAKIYDLGIDAGIEIGKKHKIEEFKRVLDIDFE